MTRTRYVLSYRTRDGEWHRNYEAEDVNEVRAFWRDFPMNLRGKFTWKLEREDITQVSLDVKDE